MGDISEVISKNPQGKSFKMNVGPAAESAMQDLMSELNMSRTELIKYSLGFMRTFVDARKEGHYVAVVDANENPLRELALPEQYDPGYGSRR